MLKIFHNRKYGDIRFVNAVSTLPDHTVVVVTFFYEGNLIQRNVSLKKKSNSELEAINEAKAIIDGESESGYLETYSLEYINKVIKKKRILFIASIACVVISIIFISLFIWKAVGGK